MNNDFSITIGASSPGGVDFSKELQLIKVALLYGDTVRFCSPKASMLSSIMLLFAFGEKAKFDILEELVVPVAKLQGQENEVERAFQIYERLSKQKRLSRDQLFLKMRMKSIIDQCWSKMRDEIHVKIYVPSRLSELIPAIERKLLKIDLFNIEQSSSTDEYFEVYTQKFIEIISNELIEAKTFPLFDENVGNLLNALFTEGNVKYSNAGIEKARHIGFVSDLFHRLPNFDEATVDEILDIRKELQTPLVRFRAAIMRYSSEIKHEPWNDEFCHEAEKIFYREIEPAVLEIEEECKNNKYIYRVINKTLQKPWLPLIGVFVSSISTFPQLSEIGLATILDKGKIMTLLATTGKVLYEATKEWKEKLSEIKKNQMYFYYQTRKKIKT
jgi:hypothetical protein